MDKLSELAMHFKNRDNPTSFDISTALVVSINPIILKLSEKVFLSAEYNNLVISAHMLEGYKRKIDFTGISGGKTSIAGSPSHEHDIVSLKGEVTFYDGIKIGDEIIVVPISNGAMWYAIDKAVRP